MYQHQPVSHAVTTSGPGSSTPVASHPQLGGKTILVPNHAREAYQSDSEELTDPDAEGQEEEEADESDAEGVTDDAESEPEARVKTNGAGSSSKRTNHRVVDSEENDLDAQMWGLRRSVSCQYRHCEELDTHCCVQSGTTGPSR